METRFFPATQGTIFEAEFSWVDTVGNIKNLWICGEIVDWKFHIHNISKHDKCYDILNKQHLSYIYRLLDVKANHSHFLKLKENYVVQGRKLYLNCTRIIDIPNDYYDIIAS